ncbi:MAG TPA: hypothetical protein VKW04_09410 [Planctomycetota bacterium]|nr:hypothetical protein [Planctomycetota bacterium]
MMHSKGTRGKVLGRWIAPALAVLWIPAAARADELRLRSGQVLEGIVRQEPGKFIVETGWGTMTFPADQVQAVVPRPTAMDEYPGRLSALGPQPGAAEVFALALWARDHGLVRYVEPLLEKTIALDPQYGPAHRLLDQVPVNGRWVSRGELERRSEVTMKTPEAVAAEAAHRRRLAAHPLPEQSPGYVYFGIPPMGPPRGSQNHGGYGTAFPFFQGVSVMP